MEKRQILKSLFIILSVLSLLALAYDNAITIDDSHTVALHEGSLAAGLNEAGSVSEAAKDLLKQKKLSDNVVDEANDVASSHDEHSYRKGDKIPVIVDKVYIFLSIFVFYYPLTLYWHCLDDFFKF